MLGLGLSVSSPYVGSESGYVNRHSLSLDSDGDYFDANNTLQNEIRNSWSVSAWVKLDDGIPSVSQYFVGARTSSNIFGLAVTTSGTISFIHQAGSGIALYSTDAAVFSNGETDWTHVGVTVKEVSPNTVYNIFVNGDSVAATQLFAVSLTNHNLYTSTINLAFGAQQNGAGSAVGNTSVLGFMDECAFFNAAISPGAMSAIGGGGTPTDITGHDNLLLYYKMNNDIVDEVGTSNGTLRGGAAFTDSSKP